MLQEKKCKSCEGGIPPLNLNEIMELMRELMNWEIDQGHLVKWYSFKNFKETMVFVNKVADLAEEEGHHPNLFVSYNQLKVELWTHAINGLSENDFILAAKIDALSL